MKAILDGIFQWIKNITYYLIFISLISNLMPNGKYDRYIKLFSGAVFILIVVGPLMGSLKLDEKLAYAYQQIRFAQDTSEFEKQLWGMETQRMGQIIQQYEEAVAQDVKAMAEAEGFECVEAAVQIEKDAGSENFGQVVGMELVLEGGKEDGWMEAGSADVEAEGFLEKKTGKGEEGSQTMDQAAVEPVEDVQVRVEADKNSIREGEGTGSKTGGIEGNAGALSRARRAREQKEQEALYGFQRKVAGYYGLEEANIRITRQDDEGKLDHTALRGTDPYDSSHALRAGGR
ncbi:MAG: stage III sporulation protein AF [Lachnospiraceae bacterium]|nr:stage III sporulation protein AF [Lachnospiraceae bacterium]